MLAELTAAGEVGVAYRQLASVLLRQYLECHWSSQAERFSEPVPSEQVSVCVVISGWCVCVCVY